MSTVIVSENATKKSSKIVAPPTPVISIQPPRFGQARFVLTGTAPLVVHRMSEKLKIEMKQKMEGGKPTGNVRNREAKDTDVIYQDGKYISKQGWEGVHAGAFRNAMISACRLVNFKMTLARLSVFIIADGWDKKEPQIPLIRIFGEPTKQEDIGRVANGNPYLIVRPAYYDWTVKLQVRWDLDQFNTEQVTNLLVRVGQQVGIGEGRPDSKNSAGMGWGLFDVKGAEPIR